MKLFDAHCHLANLSEKIPLLPLLQDATEKGISSFVSSVLRKNELIWHRQNPDKRIIFSAGIHPNFDECDLDLALIKQLCEAKTIWAIGEIGLDNGNPEIDWQREVFRAQLQLAVSFALPVVLHIVGHQSEACETIKQYSLPYLVHGYAGSKEGFEQLSSLKPVFTISSRLLKEDKFDLLLAMLNYPHIMFETDITQYYVKTGETNPLLRLINLVEACSELSGISVQDLLNRQQKSAELILPTEFA